MSEPRHCACCPKADKEWMAFPTRFDLVSWLAAIRFMEGVAMERYYGTIGDNLGGTHNLVAWLKRLAIEDERRMCLWEKAASEREGKE